MGREEFKKIAGEICRELRASKKAPGEERIYTAGEKEYLAWLDRKDKGVPLNASERSDLTAVRDKLGLDYTFPWEGIISTTYGHNTMHWRDQRSAFSEILQKPPMDKNVQGAVPVMQCPSATSSPIVVVAPDRTHNYSYIVNMGASYYVEYGSGSHSFSGIPRKITRYPSPSRVVWIADSYVQHASFENAANAASMNPNDTNRRIDYRHNKMVNFVCLDGSTHSSSKVNNTAGGGLNADYSKQEMEY
jgi:hypothetical protein